jgi:feruloyl esterase
MKALFPLLVIVILAPTVYSAPCDSVKAWGRDQQKVVVTLAEPVARGAFTPQGGRGAEAFKSLPAFCRVAATITPVPDSEIKIEVWLPESGWNGKLQSVGNGAWAGSIGYPAMATALAAGYATAGTDTGHTGNNPNFITGHPEKVNDFGYRAIHEMTVLAKGIIGAYYGGTGPKYSYFNGCSTGGRQALTEAQRYPNDYDGILAGAPAIYASRLQGMQVWAAQTMHKDEASFIPPAKYAAIHNAVLEQCDAIDGVKDGVLENPRKCTFDPKVLLCKESDSSSCLTAPQVEAATRLYAGPKLFPGLERGSELGWNTLGGPQPMSLATDVYKYLVFNNPGWDYKTINPQTDFPLAEKAIAGSMDATNPNLKPFVDRGGKLIMYHGWSDPGIPPMNTVQYYNNVTKSLGVPKTANSIRLFMIPGMNHCQGGNGTDKFDGIGTLAQWVETGKAPSNIVASHQTAGKVDRTRPLCPYPAVATYKGSGSTDDAANFVCR